MTHLHIFRIKYKWSDYMVKAKEGNYMNGQDAMNHVGISSNGLIAIKRVCTSKESPNYAQWIKNKENGMTDEDNFIKVFGNN